MRQVLRFYGFRKLAFGLAAWPASRLTVWLLGGGPPSGWYSWPADARAAVGWIVDGGQSLAFFGWLWLLSTPLRALPNPHVRYAAWGLLAAAAVCWAAPGAIQLLAGVARWLRGGAPQSVAILWLLVRLSVIPLTIGTALACWPDVAATLQANATYRRWFVSGQGGPRRRMGWCAGDPAKDAGAIREPTVATRPPVRPDSPWEDVVRGLLHGRAGRLAE